MKKKLKLALIGTDSLRGREIKRVLEQKDFPFRSINFFDDDVGEEYGKLTEFRGEPKIIYPINEDTLDMADIIFLAADKEVNKRIIQEALPRGKWVIDLNETFAAEGDSRVIVAGINDNKIPMEVPRLISNPHPASIFLSHMIHLIDQNLGLRKSIAFILQPVSAFDVTGMDELANQSAELLGGNSLSKKVFKEQIAFNLLSHVDTTDKNGFTSVEKQIRSETKKIFENDKLPLSLTMVQAPVFHTYSIMIYIEVSEKAEIDDIRSLFNDSSYFHCFTNSDSCQVSSVSASGKNEIQIGEIKKDLDFPNGFWIWAIADNLTRGSALNGYEIASILNSINYEDK